MAELSRPGRASTVPVCLYVPNLIGYVRVALNFVALHYALSGEAALRIPSEPGRTRPARPL
jgi:hypothetical protein